MTAVVLRHPNLPGQPIVVDVPVGSYVSGDLQASGWTIDTSTTSDEAIAESDSTRQAAAEQAQTAAEDFVPEFPPADDTAPVDTTSKPAPTPTPSPSPSVEPVDTSKEN